MAWAWGWAAVWLNATRNTRFSPLSPLSAVSPLPEAQPARPRASTAVAPRTLINRFFNVDLLFEWCGTICVLPDVIVGYSTWNGTRFRHTEHQISPFVFLHRDLDSQRS